MLRGVAKLEADISPSPSPLWAFAERRAGGEAPPGLPAVPGAPAAAAPLAERLSRCQRTFFGRAYVLAGNEADAWDLLQDTFERALRAAPAGMPDKALHAWLGVVMRNQFVSHLRARRPLVPFDEALEERTPAPEPARECDPLDLLGAADVDEAACALAPGLRDVLALARAGHGYAEIATRLGLPKNTVGTRLLRARRALRKRLEERLRQRMGGDRGR
jgi:RNA polymerase sigma-70 factor, ECF subfamily